VVEELKEELKEDDDKEEEKEEKRLKKMSVEEKESSSSSKVHPFLSSLVKQLRNPFLLFALFVFEEKSSSSKDEFYFRFSRRDCQRVHGRSDIQNTRRGTFI
jgi:hypothetical protein